MTVHRVQAGNVAVVTIDRPARANALDPATYAALRDAVAAADDDPDTRVVVVTAVGDRAFCAGLDIAALDAGDLDAFGHQRSGRFFPFDLDTPLVAAVNGAAVAGGFELVLACDVVIAAEHARFGLPEVSRGLIAGGGGIELSRRIPLVSALELVLTGELVDASRARELGLVNRVVPATSLMDEAMRVAVVIAANAPQSVALSKALVWEAAGLRARSGDPRYRIDRLLAGDDAREGPRAFMERRAPRWSGRPAPGA